MGSITKLQGHDFFNKYMRFNVQVAFIEALVRFSLILQVE